MSDQPEPGPKQFPSFLDLPPRGATEGAGRDAPTDGEQPTTVQPAAAADPADGEQPTTVQPAVDQPTEAQPAVEQPTEAHPPVEQPTVEGEALSEALAQATAPAPTADTGSLTPAVPADATTPEAAAPADAAAAEQPTEPVERKPGFRERGRMRRRLRYLRKVRELQARDLGGLVFDLRRYERKRDDLVAQKVDQIRACDDELRALEIALEERRDVRDVREPGIGGTCPRCFSLYGSMDRFCSHCGVALGGAGQGPQQVAPAQPIAPPPQPAGTQLPAGSQPVGTQLPAESQPAGAQLPPGPQPAPGQQPLPGVQPPAGTQAGASPTGTQPGAQSPPAGSQPLVWGAQPAGSQPLSWGAQPPAGEQPPPPPPGTPSQ